MLQSGNEAEETKEESMLALIVVGLATWQAVEIYRHSSLFENIRYVLQGPPDHKPENFVEELFSCGWCLSVWVAVVLAALFYIPLLSLFVYGLAISKVANVLHDFYGWVEEQLDNARQDRERYLERLASEDERASLTLHANGSMSLSQLKKPDNPRQDD